jgi:phosphate transport system permease protein
MATECNRSGLEAPLALSERVIARVLQACGWLSVLTTAGIIGVLLFEALALVGQISIVSFANGNSWKPLFADQGVGVWPLLSGPMVATLIALCLALPLGLLAAIYLAELAPRRLAKVLKPALEVLAGVPTVVHGYFALRLVTPALQQVVPGLARFDALSPGIVMGIMILPVIASLSRDAIAAVPASLREGAYALGATEVGTVFRVVLPSAWPGILAAIVQGVSRAIGETMIVVIAARGGISHQEAAFRVNAAAGIVALLGLMLIMNGLAIWSRRRLERRIYW